MASGIHNEFGQTLDGVRRALGEFALQSSCRSFIYGHEFWRERRIRGAVKQSICCPVCSVHLVSERDGDGCAVRWKQGSILGRIILFCAVLTRGWRCRTGMGRLLALLLMI